jgi:CRP-like cAMP-binding protein
MGLQEVFFPENRLLQRFPSDVKERLQTQLKRVYLERGTVLHHPGQNIDFLYFPISCMISITVTLRDGRMVEAGAVGIGEVVGINAIMGGRETTQTKYIVEVPGYASKIAAASLRREFDNNKESRLILLKYIQFFIAHISQNAVCNRLHDIESRCARWLLEVRERLNSDEMALTQEFVSEMLGTGRPTVSITLGKLRHEGIIDYGRGKIFIRDVETLERRSCECRDVTLGEYNRLFPFVELTRLATSGQRSTKVKKPGRAHSIDAN